MKKPFLLFACFLLFAGCEESKSQLSYREVFTGANVEAPVDIQFPDDGSGEVYMVSQKGTIYAMAENGTGSDQREVLDIRGQVKFGGEMGLLGLAFHPEFPSKPLIYVNYVTNNLETRIAEFKIQGGAATRSSERVLLEVEQPYGNHNGGQLVFGPDGFLYNTYGDGGSANDPHGNGQDPSTLLGTIIRIDVDSRTGGKPYGIPADNPFVNDPDKKPEIYAYGLRNVWRFSFDRETGTMWAADVGQNKFEEVDIIEKGGNYGWNIKEGFHCFDPPEDCSSEGLIDPVWEYSHSEGQSITGGFVYRGNALSNLAGAYFCADYVSGKIWYLKKSGSGYQAELYANTDFAVSTFGQDLSGELYFTDYADNKFYRLSR